ncbi:MAG: ABC transporter permease, partial [Candidatus Electryonea clarkiae]|nr:ABC transporter permease [Candidatus Electryonea clarkiae]
MLRYVVQRLFFMIVTMLLVSVIIFIIIELPPGDYADRYAYSKLATAGQSVTESDMIALRHEFGLDKPPIQRYFGWVSDIILHGDFGDSFLYHVPVTSVIGARIWLTMAIALT